MSLTYSNTQFNDDDVETGNSIAMDSTSDPPQLGNIWDGVEGVEEPRYPPFSHLRPHSVEQSWPMTGLKPDGGPEYTGMFRSRPAFDIDGGTDHSVPML